MNVVAKDLTDEQIEDVAAWYASHTATPVLSDGYTTAAAPMSCFGCHGANGIARMQDAPNLAGDDRVYAQGRKLLVCFPTSAATPPPRAASWLRRAGALGTCSGL